MTNHTSQGFFERRNLSRLRRNVVTTLLGAGHCPPPRRSKPVIFFKKTVPFWIFSLKNMIFEICIKNYRLYLNCRKFRPFLEFLSSHLLFKKRLSVSSQPGFFRNKKKLNKMSYLNFFLLWRVQNLFPKLSTMVHKEGHCRKK